jgi:hypothetical protein
MKRLLQCALGLSFAATLYGQITVNEPIPHTATIEGNTAAVGKQEIPRTIFGTLLEPYTGGKRQMRTGDRKGVCLMQLARMLKSVQDPRWISVNEDS